MNELMQACAKIGLPFYLENPLRSKLWITPQIIKWIRHKGTTLVQFDYCQFNQEWMKPTQILAYNNKNFCASLGRQCKPTWVDGKSLCSRTGLPHVALKGKEPSGKYKTATACPYPEQLATHWAKVLVRPRRDRRMCDIQSEDCPRAPDLRNPQSPGGDLINAYPAISVTTPDAEHYLTHLPKHPGCATCNNCKVQRKQRRDHDKAEKRKWKAEQNTSICKYFPELVEPYVKADKPNAPAKFGDSVTSDSIIVVKQSKFLTSEATSLSVKDRGTGWIAGYPSRGHATSDILQSVLDFKGSAKIHHWYSDGARELHAACVKEGIRHDIADSDRHESNGVIERTNRTIIEGTRCLLHQSGLPHKYWPSAMQTFCCNYNFTHTDSKKGTNPHVERHGLKFGGTTLVYGQRIKYLPSSTRELAEKQKFDAVLRDGIFCGYRMHSGGVWAGQYLVIDAERFQEVKHDTMHVAYEHGVSEVYVPGTAADDKQDKLQFPCKTGLWKESGATTTDSTIVGDAPTSGLPRQSEAQGEADEALQTIDEDTLPSQIRPEIVSDQPGSPQNAGGEGADANSGIIAADNVPAPESDRKDYWSLQGDILVRVHQVPRTTLFAPQMAPEDEPPIPIRNFEVSRTTKPSFSGETWPGLETIEDAWCGHDTDAKTLLHPVDGTTLTWTGETLFERILPEPPRGKEWCQGTLVRSRAGSKRSKDIHPLQWWLLSESARVKASDIWQAKFKEMKAAIRRRTIPREPLEEMPTGRVPAYLSIGDMNYHLPIHSLGRDCGRGRRDVGINNGPPKNTVHNAEIKFSERNLNGEIELTRSSVVSSGVSPRFPD